MSQNTRWTQDQLNDYYRRQKTSDADAKLPHPKPKRVIAPTLGGAIQGKTEGIRCAAVGFVGYRVRPLDPDNFAGSVKHLLDGLRHAQIISGDEPWRLRLETEQVKVAHFNQEKTVIHITP